MKDQKRLTTSVILGVTLPVGDGGYVKPQISINDIDPAESIEDQIRVGLETAIRAIVEIDGQLEVVLSEILAPETKVPGIKDRLKPVEAFVETTKRNFANLKTRLTERDELTNQLIARVEELERGR